MPVPGLVDLHVNGFMGVDFSAPDLTEEAVVYACRALVSRGTAAFLATMITSALPVYQHNLPILVGVRRKPEFQAHLLGVHLEGPFISPQPGAVGAHNPEYVKGADASLLKQLLAWAEGQVRLLTLAAELPEVDELARVAVAQGITVSIGHSLAGEDDLDRLVQAGAKALTHLGNGLPNSLPRHPNPIWAGLANDALTAMVIADGHHLPGMVLKTFLRAKGIERIVVVSDAAPVAGLPPGQYVTLGNQAILEESGRLYNPEKHCLVGSSATMLQCVNFLAGLGLMPESDLLRVAVDNPLRLIELDQSAISGPARLRFDPQKQQFEMLY